MNIKQAILSARDTIQSGANIVVNLSADDGYSVRVQRTDHNNCRKARIVTHVWKDGKRVRAELVAEILMSDGI